MATEYIPLPATDLDEIRSTLKRDQLRALGKKAQSLTRQANRIKNALADNKAAAAAIAEQLGEERIKDGDAWTLMFIDGTFTESLDKKKLLELGVDLAIIKKATKKKKKKPHWRYQFPKAKGARGESDEEE